MKKLEALILIITVVLLISSGLAIAQLPSISINDPHRLEGNAGTTSEVIFDVKLSAPSNQLVTVSFATADGTATAGSDYVATSGMLNFNAGETFRSISVRS